MAGFVHILTKIGLKQPRVFKKEKGFKTTVLNLTLQSLTGV